MIEDPGCLDSSFGCWNPGCEMCEHGDRGIGYGSFIKGEEYQASPNMVVPDLPKNTRSCHRHGWITHTRIDENPVVRGTRSLL